MKIFLSIILAIFFSKGNYSQTTKYTFPVKDATSIMDSAQMLPYTQVQYDYEEDSLRMYIYSYKSNRAEILKSVDGVHWQFFSFVNGTMESVVRAYDRVSVWYGLWHKYNQPIKQYFYKVIFSEDDGVTWIETPDTLCDGTSKWFGEDHTVTYNSAISQYFLFLRSESSSLTQFRKISLVKTPDYINFSQRKLVFPSDTSNFRNKNSKDWRKTFYNGTMFQTASNRYWFYCNVYNLDSGFKGNTQLIRDTTGKDNCVWGELMFSDDGENWNRNRDTIPFLRLRSGIRQIFGSPIVIGNSLYIYTFESRIPHLDVNPEKPAWTIERYRIPISALELWRSAIIRVPAQDK
jgi:hypothetical protein